MVEGFRIMAANRKDYTITRIRRSTRRKLVRLAEIDERSPVVVLDRVISDALRRRGIDPDSAVTRGAT